MASAKIATIAFDMNTVEAQDTLINPGRYNAVIEQARFVDMPDGTQRLWIGARLSNNRFVTTLCATLATAKSAYKTKALAVATQAHLGLKQAGIPADADMLVGAELIADVTIWQPSNGVPVNDIRTFITK